MGKLVMNRDGFMLSIMCDNKENIICKRYLKVRLINDDLINNKLTRILTLIEHDLLCKQQWYAPINNIDTNEIQLIFSVFIDDIIINKKSLNIGHFNKKLRHNIDIRELIPDIIDELNS